MDIQKTKVKTNLDTNFLKLIGIITMTCDHAGKMLLPNILILQIIGRIAFPIFAYCIVVGSLFTRNVWKYLGRLVLLAVLFQIVYTFYCLPHWQNTFLVLNIFFTLAIGLLCIIGIKEKKWWLTAIAAVLAYYLNVDYGFFGVLLIVVFYLLRDYPIISIIVVTVQLLLMGSNFSYPFFWSLQSYAVLSLPFIYIRTNSNLKINKYVFYAYYPLHFLVLYLIEFLIKK